MNDMLKDKLKKMLLREHFIAGRDLHRLDECLKTLMQNWVAIVWTDDDIRNALASRGVFVSSSDVANISNWVEQHYSEETGITAAEFSMAVDDLRRDGLISKARWYRLLRDHTEDDLSFSARHIPPRIVLPAGAIGMIIDREDDDFVLVSFYKEQAEDCRIRVEDLEETTEEAAIADGEMVVFR